MNRRLSFLFTVLLLMTTGLALAEWVVRSRLESPAHAKILGPAGWVDPPGSDWVYSREGYSRGTRNGEGFVGPPVRLDAPRRVLLLGDSYAEALEVDPRRTLAAVTEGAVPDLCVINAGRSGQSPVHHAAFLPSMTRRYRQQLTVILVNDGDLGDLQSAGALSGSAAETLKRFKEEYSTLVTQRTGWRGAVESLVRRSGLLTFAYRRGQLLAATESSRLRAKFAPPPPENPVPDEQLPVDPRLAAVYDDLLAEIRLAAGDVLLVYVPLLVYRSDSCEPKWPHRRAFYHDLARRTGVELIDLTEPFQESFRTTGQPVHGFANSRPGSGHMNQRGHAMVGQLLAERLTGGDSR